MPWNYVVHLGDLPLTLAAAAAMSVWMMTSRLWRLAVCWTLLFLTAIMLVTASKIAFLLWDVGSQAINFSALSGHATGATAVLVVFLHLVMQRFDGRFGNAGIVAGLLLGGLLCLALVVRHEHTIAEAAAGWLVGALAGVGAIRLAGQIYKPSSTCGTHCIVGAFLVFVCAVALLRQLPLGYLIWRCAAVIASQITSLSTAKF
ncbi:hypothetical protein [Massilia sp. PWRC2]|uniref:hypothetical protein n=1 Tax=Massilia sp. PWRC2 TaxID=2804626 RepID=UPI003CFB00F4